MPEPLKPIVSRVSEFLQQAEIAYYSSKEKSVELIAISKIFVGIASALFNKALTPSEQKEFPMIEERIRRLWKIVWGHY